MQDSIRLLSLGCASVLTIFLLTQSQASVSGSGSEYSNRGLVPIRMCAVGAPFGNGANEQFPKFASLDDRGTGTIAFAAFGYSALVAPNTWTCSGFRAEDGGSIFTAVPHGESAPPISSGMAFDQPATSRIVVFAEVANQSGIWSITCALFPSQRHEYPGRCPYPVSRRESDARDGSDVVEFSDPPGVKGSGQPSGGAEPSVGAVVFRHSSTAKITCVLPASEGDVCRVAVGTFVDYETNLATVGEADARVTTVLHGH